ncbi:MAG: beta-lactamase family protein, partial [Cyclobacteriaceae bacterium]|nr:beta-lactamase family protein [Cyclobacteriaceae bacterium]
NDGISFSNVPGVAYEYSNLGYALLGQIISNVSGIPYQQYITNNILKPLGMNNSYWEIDEIPKDQVALGYLWENDQWAPEPILHDGAYGAMGGLFSTLEDFAKYAALHLDAWPPRNDPETGPVKRSSIREMHQPWRFNNLFADAKNRMGSPCAVIAGYGYGLSWRKDCTGIVRIAHSGGLPGYGSEWRIYPELGIGVISFSNNRYGAPSQANAIAIDTLVSLAKLKPRTLPASQILLERKEQLVKMLPDMQDSPIFAENFFMDQSLENRKKEIAAIFADAGAPKNIGEFTAFNQLRGRFTIEYENKNVNVFFTLTPEKKPLIQQLEVWVE